MSANQNTSIRPTVLRFRTASAILSRLGSEQLKDDSTAILELVKNSYDADATKVTVEFRNIDGHLRLIVRDDGSGMTTEDLKNKWALLATENKTKEIRSPRFRRRRLGQKGVGRFAAEKLGRELILRTSSSGDRKIRQIRFDWDEMLSDHELSEYEFDIQEKKQEPFEHIPGTTLIIRELRTKWDKKKTEVLRTQLARLIDPESSAADFSIFLNTPWEDLNGRLDNPLPGKETHFLTFELDERGREDEDIGSHGQVIKNENHRVAPSFGAIRGKLRYYGKGLQRIERSRGGDPDADWNVGIRIFRDGFRVRPYGEPGPQGDWLQIYRTRYLKGGKFRLKPHYLEGAIHISSDTNPNLRDTTSREGLDDNEEYGALVDYVQEKIIKLSDCVREEEVKEERARTQEKYKQALNPLTEGLGRLRSEVYKEAVERADKEVKKELRRVQEISAIKNAHWECLDCSDSWKAPLDKTPTRCREFSVGRDGLPSQKKGCGSSNIRRKENIQRGGSAKREFSEIDDILAGIPAYVSGIQIRPVIDWEMGENDDEAEIRADKRELAINGRHASFRIAEKLDGSTNVEGTTFESLQAVGALTVHVIDAACLAWARWHFEKQDQRMDVFLSAYTALKDSCRTCILEKVNA